MHRATSPGTLYLVATPIGNREDISLRALATFKSVDFVLAEDTRHSGLLLSFLGIQKPMFALHAHNEAKQSEVVLKRLLQGESCALISDAGTPLISDPGYPLVKRAREMDINVVPIPGPCALIAALSASGVPCDVFTFAGFLPAKQAARQKKLNYFLAYEHTLVFYESTHRIVECLHDIVHIYGEDCPLVLAKELTKTHERFVMNTAGEVLAWLVEDSTHEKGEFVLIIPPRVTVSKSLQSIHHYLSVLMRDHPLKQAVKIVSELTGMNKNEVYMVALKQNQQS